jgi:hypothetical protein
MSEKIKQLADDQVTPAIADASINLYQSSINKLCQYIEIKGEQP